MIDQTVKIREWEKFDYNDPEEFLRQLRNLEVEVSLSDLPDRVKALRTNKLRFLNENRQAALFATGLITLNGYDNLDFTSSENADYDAIFRRIENDTIIYTPIQLKELVPKRWNSKAALREIVKKLRKYSDSHDLVVAIFHNQKNENSQLNLTIPKDLNIGGLYVYGCCSIDQSEWFIAGDFMIEAFRWKKFKYLKPDTKLNVN